MSKLKRKRIDASSAIWKYVWQGLHGQLLLDQAQLAAVVKGTEKMAYIREDVEAYS